MEQLALDRREADHGNGVEVADGDESAVAGESPEPLSLSARMLAIMERCDAIQKENAGMGTGHAIDTVLNAVRPLLVQHKILITPELVSIDYDGNRCDVVQTFTWECVDTGESRTLKWAGADTDKAGKGFAKASTNALKEHLKKVLKITDQQDKREETDQVEHVNAEGMTAAKAEESEAKIQSATAQGLNTLKAAYESAGSTKALERLRRDNKDLLESVPQVTRGFFNDLYESRRRELQDAEAQEAAEMLE